MRSKLFISSLLLIATAACMTNDAESAKSADTSATAMAGGDNAAASNAIAAMRSGWKDAADRKDSTAVAAFYADDAVLATSNSPVATGKAAIEKTLGRMVNLSKITSIDSKALVIMGDDGYDYGTFTQEAPDANGKVVASSGYYVVTFHKQSDGTWKITRHVSTTPPVMP